MSLKTLVMILNALGHCLVSLLKVFSELLSAGILASSKDTIRLVDVVVVSFHCCCWVVLVSSVFQKLLLLYLLLARKRNVLLSTYIGSI